MNLCFCLVNTSLQVSSVWPLQSALIKKKNLDNVSQPHIYEIIHHSASLELIHIHHFMHEITDITVRCMKTILSKCSQISKDAVNSTPLVVLYGCVYSVHVFMCAVNLKRVRRGEGEGGEGRAELGTSVCTCFPYLSPPEGTVWHFLCSSSCSGVLRNLWQTSHSNIRVMRWIWRCRSYMLRVLHTKLQKTHSKPAEEGKRRG